MSFSSHLAMETAFRVGAMKISLQSCAFVVSAAFLGSCDRGEDFDWCTEAQEAESEGFIPISGEILVTYRGDRAPAQTVAITAYARPDVLGSEVAYIQGCSHDGGDLWRFRGGFSGLVPTTNDVAVEVTQSSVSGVAFAGELYFCPGGDCSGSRMETLSGLSATGMGTLHVYAPAQRHIEAEVSSIYGLTDGLSVSIDATWTPLPAP